MALPAALGAALSNVRGMRALASAVGGSAPRGSGRRAASCCSMSCLGCLACGALAGAVALSIGSALLAATASVVGIGGSLNCPRVSATACASLTGAAVGAPMNCPTMYVSQGYGDTPWEHPHAGMDIVCPPATMVVAVADGVFHRDQGAPIACSYPPGRLGGLGSFGVPERRWENLPVRPSGSLRSARRRPCDHRATTRVRGGYWMRDRLPPSLRGSRERTAHRSVPPPSRRLSGSTRLNRLAVLGGSPAVIVRRPTHPLMPYARSCLAAG